MIKKIIFTYKDGKKILDNEEYLSNINFSNRVVGKSDILEIVNKKPYDKRILKEYKTESDLISVEIFIDDTKILFDDPIREYLYYYDFIDNVLKEYIEIRFR